MGWWPLGWSRLRWEKIDRDGTDRWFQRGASGRATGRQGGSAAAKNAGQGPTEEAPTRRSWRWTAGFGLVILLLHTLLFPPISRVSSDFPAAGAISMREIRAPFQFSAPLLPRDVETMRMERVLRQPPVLERLATEEALGPLARFEAWRDAVRVQLARTEVHLSERISLLGLGFPQLPLDVQRRTLAAPDPEAVLAAVTTALTALFEGGVVDMLPPGNYVDVVIVSADAEEVRPAPQITTQSDVGAALPRLLSASGLPAADAVWVASLARHFVIPNLGFDQAETRIRQDRVREAVATEREYEVGERVVDQGVRVTPQVELSLVRLHEILNERGDSGPGGLLRAVTRLLLLAVALGLYGWLGGVHFGNIFRRFRYLAALGGSMMLFLLGAAFALSKSGLGDFAVPIPLVALLVTVLFGERAGYTTTLLAIVLLALLPETGSGALLVWVVTGTVTVMAVRRIRKRNQFYQTIALLTGLTLFLITLVGLAAGAELSEVASRYMVGIFMPVVTVALALFLLPVVEPLVGVSSSLTLLELSDLNHPLLKRLALEAQGTYHHCQVVSQLAEHAAQSIGANALLARAGALFHDIGKLGKPDYFVENQRDGLNKHDELSPSMSALVVEAHVKDGIELARRWRLPQAVIDFIPEHHGTSVMEFFYRKALEDAENETVKVDDFRYPGPKPRSRETGILMIVDALEAATRALPKPTPGRIREVTRQIVDKRLLSGELDETNLTIKDLARIREACIPLLTSIHHSRIAYPGPKTKPRNPDRNGERRAEG